MFTCRRLITTLAAAIVLSLLGGSAAASVRVGLKPFSGGFERGFESDSDAGLEPGTLPGVRVGFEIPGSTRLGLGVVASAGHFERFDTVAGALTPVKMDVMGYGGVMLEQELLSLPDAGIEAWADVMIGGAVRCQRGVPLEQGLCPHMEAVPMVEIAASLRYRPLPGVRLTTWLGWRRHLQMQAPSQLLGDEWTGAELSGFSARLRLSIDL